MSTNGHSQQGGGRRSRRKRHKTHNLAGKLIVLVQLLMTVLFIAVVWNSGLIPGKYLGLVTVVLFVLFGAMFGLQFVKKKIYIAGIVVSVFFSVLLGFGVYYMMKTDNMLAEVGGATYKTYGGEYYRC